MAQGDQWPTERYMTYWQPRALPTTDLGGDVIFEGPNDASETNEILRLLDQLALKYTSETLE